VLAHEVGVTSEPEVATHALQEGDRLLVLASDGVWEHLTDQQVIDVAAQAGGYHPTAAVASFDAAAAARAVCAAARVAWTQQSAAAVDDITAVVAYLTHAVQSEASQEPAIIDGNYGVNGGARPARMSLKTEVSWHLAR
jgi:serine/threonine protein phosphatase PrpC